MSGQIEKLLEKANFKNDDANSVSFAKKTFASSEQARQAFLKLKIALDNISEWNRCAAISSYKLFDEAGKACAGQTLYEGAFNRITLRGSGKSDWVRVVRIDESESEKIITVTPSADPRDDTKATSHFFTGESTNNFCLLRHENSITFYVIGLHEKTNLSETENIFETVRNFAVANLGSYFGIQKGEWQNFCQNFLDLPILSEPPAAAGG